MTTRLTTLAVLLKTPVPHGESSLIVPLLTEAQGRVTTFARAGRRSSRRFPVLEPFHTMRVEIDPPTRELALLASAEVVTPRLGYLTSLRRMRAAGKGLEWVALVCPERAVEPAVWAALTAYLDTAQRCPDGDLAAEAAAFGVTLLRAVGWAPPSGALWSGMEPVRALRVVDAAVQANAGR
jgi:DNA repair protein RecO (recombination protein O)